MKKNAAITLLELMLSLAVIAILLIAAMRYFESTRSSQRVNDGIRTMQTAMQAADNWYATFKSYTSPTAPGGTITVAELIKMNIVPADFATNPWGGAVTITANDANHVSIELTEVSTGDCEQLQAILKEHGFVGECTEGKFSLTYP